MSRRCVRLCFSTVKLVDGEVRVGASLADVAMTDEFHPFSAEQQVTAAGKWSACRSIKMECNVPGWPPRMCGRRMVQGLFCLRRGSVRLPFVPR